MYSEGKDAGITPEHGTAGTLFPVSAVMMMNVLIFPTICTNLQTSGYPHHERGTRVLVRIKCQVLQDDGPSTRQRRTILHLIRREDLWRKIQFPP